MTRDELIQMLKDNLEPNAEMDFVYINNPFVEFLDIEDICMNADIDDPSNQNRGGIVFREKECIFRVK